MKTSPENRFEDFFADDAYVSLKNHLYNYLMRKRAVKQCLHQERIVRILEVGSGLSPMIDDAEQIVYTDFSFSALRILKRQLSQGHYVVADAAHLPFKSRCFSQVICSEVLEHLAEDQLALREMAAVMSPEGSLVLTFPHRRGYFGFDDRFVNHLRRYELGEMEENLKTAGLQAVEIKKIFGPLEKITMLSATLIASALARLRKNKQGRGNTKPSPFVVFVFQWLNRLYCALIWLDAKLTPQRISTVLLIRAAKNILREDVSA